MGKLGEVCLGVLELLFEVGVFVHGKVRGKVEEGGCY